MPNYIKWVLSEQEHRFWLDCARKLNMTVGELIYHCACQYAHENEFNPYDREGINALARTSAKIASARSRRVKASGSGDAQTGR